MKKTNRIKRTMLAAAMFLCALQGLNAQEINYKTPPKDVMEMCVMQTKCVDQAHFGMSIFIPGSVKSI